MSETCGMHGGRGRQIHMRLN